MPKSENSKCPETTSKIARAFKTFTLFENSLSTKNPPLEIYFCMVFAYLQYWEYNKLNS